MCWTYSPLWMHRINNSMPAIPEKFRVFFPERSIQCHLPSAEKHSLPFDLEPERFEITYDVSQADIIPTMCHVPVPEIVDIIGGHPHIPVMFMPLYNVAEDTGQMYQAVLGNWRTCVDNFFVVNTDYSAQQSHPQAYCYDFLWNRQKAYFVDYDQFVPDSMVLNKKDVCRTWSVYASKKAYSLTDIKPLDSSPNALNRYRKILSPNRVHPDYLTSPRGIYRTLLSHYLLDSTAYFSNWNLDKTLESEQSDLPLNHKQFNGWWPVANHYYNTSVVSVYVETLAGSTAVRTLTEKTLDPLIKGHFILPFGYPGLISDIQSYGFQLPDWIDYSYDTETDDVRRFYLFTRELLRIRDQMDICDLINLRNRDIHILIHNRNVFWHRPYDSLYKKCCDFFVDHMGYS